MMKKVEGECSQQAVRWTAAVLIAAKRNKRENEAWMERQIGENQQKHAWAGECREDM